MGRSLGCDIIDSGGHPDSNNPFINTTTMVDTIIIDKCTEYSRSNSTDEITPTDWVNPWCMSNGVAYPCPGKKGITTGILIPPNICFENAGWNGINSSASYQKSFTTDYCKNISNSDNVAFFAIPQDDILYRINRLGYPTPEWQLPYDAFGDLKNYCVNYQSFRAGMRNEGIAISSVIASRIGLRIISRLTGKLKQLAKKALKRAFKKSSKSTDEAGEDTNDNEDLDEEGDLENVYGDTGEVGETSFTGGEEITVTETAGEEGEVAADVGEEGATVIAETAGEDAGEAGASSLLEMAGLSVAEAVPGLDVVVMVAFIAAGFANDISKSNCEYDDMNKPTLVSNARKGSKAACCRNSCAIAGIKSKCSRSGGAGFNASLFYCCMQDYDCYKNKNNQTQSTITDGNKSNFKSRCFNYKVDKENNYPTIATCHPDFRSLGKRGCGDVVGAYCSGESAFGLDQSSLLDAWSENGSVTFGNENYNFPVKSPCLNFLARQLVGGVAGLENTICTWEEFVSNNLHLLPESLSAVGLMTVQETLNSVIENYLDIHGSPVGKINEDGYIQSGDFITWFYNLCKKYPFLCQTSLTKFCYNFTSNELVESTDSKEIIKWCGCYLQDSQYTKYTQFGIERQCTPLCNLPDNIPLIGDDGIKVPCTESICMIDDVSIKLAQSYTAGPITFNQICGSCGGSKILKKYNSNYSYLDKSSISKFFLLSPLTKDDYNNLSDSFFYNQATSQNYRNVSEVAFDIIDNNSGNKYPILESNTYRIQLQSTNQKFDNVKFNLGTPIVELGTSNIIYYIASFTEDTVTNLTNQKITDTLNPTDYSKNIFKIINNTDDSSPTSHGFFYFKMIYFETGKHTINNSNDTINQTYLQSIVTDVSQFGSAVEANNCMCTIEGTFDFVNTQINGLNLNNNCSNSICHDSNGNRIPCSSNNIELNLKSSISNSIIDSIDDNNEKFVMLTDSEREKFISTISTTLFVMIMIMYILLTHFPRKYLSIIITFAVIYFFVIVIIYLVYSNSYGLDNVMDIF